MNKSWKVFQTKMRELRDKNAVLAFIEFEHANKRKQKCAGEWFCKACCLYKRLSQFRWETSCKENTQLDRDKIISEVDRMLQIDIC